MQLRRCAFDIEGRPFVCALEIYASYAKRKPRL
jgi:hypothetical protein